MTEPTTPAPKTKKRPGPKPRKGTDAALALRDIYTGSSSDERHLLRSIIEIGYSPALLREIADAVADLDDDGSDLAVDLFDVVDKRAGM